MTKFDDLHQKWLNEPGHRQAYEALEGESALLQALIRARQQTVLPLQLFSVEICMTKKTTRRPALPPAHPGEFIREDVMPAVGMTVGELAAHLGVSKRALSELVKERRGVSVDMARRLGKAFGDGPRIWLALQMQYDLWHAEQQDEPQVKRIKVPA